MVSVVDRGIGQILEPRKTRMDTEGDDLLEGRREIERRILEILIVSVFVRVFRG